MLHAGAAVPGLGSNQLYSGIVDNANQWVCAQYKYWNGSKSDHTPLISRLTYSHIIMRSMLITNIFLRRLSYSLSKKLIVPMESPSPQFTCGTVEASNNYYIFVFHYGVNIYISGRVVDCLLIWGSVHKAKVNLSFIDSGYLHLKEVEFICYCCLFAAESILLT